jgi:hypothetical protein
MNHRVALALLALVGVIAIARFARERMPTAPPGMTEAPAPAAAESDRRAASATRDLLAALVQDAALPPPTVEVVAALPRWDAPLLEVLPALRQRADAGDSTAACHLALALSACARVIARRPSPARLRTLDPADRDAVDDIARADLDDLRHGREQTCVGLGDAELDLRFDYLHAAAEAGSAAAMLAYVEGIAFETPEAQVRHADRIRLYRIDAPRYVERLLRRGDRRAAYLLARSADGFQVSMLSQVLLADARSAATLHQLGQLILGEPFTHGGPTFTPDEERDGAARARAIHARHFEQRDDRPGEFEQAGDLLRVEYCVAPG